MKNIKVSFCKRLFFIVFFHAVMAMMGFARERVQVVGLTCAEMENPVCVNQVRLGWRLQSAERAVYQKAYQVELYSNNVKVWDSKRINSDQQSSVTLDFSFMPGKQYQWRVRVWDALEKVTPWSPLASFGTAINEQWKAQWITTGTTGKQPLPYIRKVLNLQHGQVKRAVVYLCGLGSSQLYLNGELVDPTRILDPAQTDYDKRALYSAFDVTSLLTRGSNCVGIMLGKGWYTQDVVWAAGPFSYGDPILRCQVNVEYKDGTTETFGTDETWRWTEGPITGTNIYQGEHYDARNEIDGWCTVEYDDAAWRSCRKTEGTIPPRMLVQELPPMRRFAEIKATRIWKSSKTGNCWIYDFGVNRTANVKFHVNLPEGVRLVTHAAEEIDDKGEIDVRSTGFDFIGYQEEAYTAFGKGMKIWTPAFTYHGFRYVELTIEGSDAVPDETWLTVVPVHTDVAQRGTFECSEPQMNALHRLALQTFLNGFVGIPVDCNHREKCGWLGDTHAYDCAANMNFQMNNFWMKYLEDIRTTSDCFLPNTLHHKLYNTTFYYADKQVKTPFMIAPGKRLCGVASPDWGTAVVQLPWHLYLYYGNGDILNQYYDMMAHWVRHIDSTAVDNIVYEGLGDWCPPSWNGSELPTSVEFTSTAFHLLDLSIMKKVAELLNKTDDASWFAHREKEVRQAMRFKFYNPLKNTFYGQTADVMALELGLATTDEAPLVAQDFLDNVQRIPSQFLNMGIFGLSRFGAQLCRYGKAKEVVKLLTKKGDNSWGLMIDSLKVTTLWEGLPYTVASAKTNTASHCHPMQGGFDVWFYEDVLGIRPVEEAPGFREILFHPTVTDAMDWARGSLETAYGKIVSDWCHRDSTLYWKIVIPPCCHGRFVIPSDREVQVNGKPIPAESLMRDSEFEKTYRFQSGSYDIVVR